MVTCKKASKLSFLETSEAEKQKLFFCALKHLEILFPKGVNLEKECIFI